MVDRLELTTLGGALMTSRWMCDQIRTTSRGEVNDRSRFWCFEEKVSPTKRKEEPPPNRNRRNSSTRPYGGIEVK